MNVNVEYPTSSPATPDGARAGADHQRNKFDTPYQVVTSDQILTEVGQTSTFIGPVRVHSLPIPKSALYSEYVSLIKGAYDGECDSMVLGGLSKDSALKGIEMRGTVHRNGEDPIVGRTLLYDHPCGSRVFDAALRSPKDISGTTGVRRYAEHGRIIGRGWGINVLSHPYDTIIAPARGMGHWLSGKVATLLNLRRGGTVRMLGFDCEPVLYADGMGFGSVECSGDFTSIKRPFTMLSVPSLRKGTDEGFGAMRDGKRGAWITAISVMFDMFMLEYTRLLKTGEWMTDHESMVFLFNAAKANKWDKKMQHPGIWRLYLRWCGQPDDTDSTWIWWESVAHSVTGTDTFGVKVTPNYLAAMLRGVDLTYRNISHTLDRLGLVHIPMDWPELPSMHVPWLYALNSSHVLTVKCNIDELCVHKPLGHQVNGGRFDCSGSEFISRLAPLVWGIAKLHVHNFPVRNKYVGPWFHHILRAAKYNLEALARIGAYVHWERLIENMYCYWASGRSPMFSVRDKSDMLTAITNRDDDTPLSVRRTQDGFAGYDGSEAPFGLLSMLELGFHRAVYPLRYLSRTKNGSIVHRPFNNDHCNPWTRDIYWQPYGGPTGYARLNVESVTHELFWRSCCAALAELKTQTFQLKLYYYQNNKVEPLSSAPDHIKSVASYCIHITRSAASTLPSTHDPLSLLAYQAASLFRKEDAYNYPFESLSELTPAI